VQLAKKEELEQEQIKKLYGAKIIEIEEKLPESPATLVTEKVEAIVLTEEVKSEEKQKE